MDPPSRLSGLDDRVGYELINVRCVESHERSDSQVTDPASNDQTPHCPCAYPDPLSGLLDSQHALAGIDAPSSVYDVPNLDCHIQRHWADIWRKAVGPLDIPSGDGFHEFRHFYASLLIASGASVKVVQERLGHTTAQMALDTYAHLWPDSDDTTRGAVDGVFEGTSCVKTVSDMDGEIVNPLATGVVTVSRPVGGILSVPGGTGWPSI